MSFKEGDKIKLIRNVRIKAHKDKQEMVYCAGIAGIINTYIDSTTFLIETLNDNEAEMFCVDIDDIELVK